LTTFTVQLIIILCLVYIKNTFLYILIMINYNIPQESTHKTRHQRENIELLRRRLNLLDGKDKLLMLMYFENGNSCYRIAKLLGVCEATITRRIHKLTKHLTGQPYQTYRKYRKRLKPEQINIARDHFLMALSIKQIATKRKCSIYRVRNTLREIRAIFKADSPNIRPVIRKINSFPQSNKPQHKRKEVKNGNIQHFKKFSMAGKNHRSCSISLQNVRPYHRKAGQAQSCP